MDEESRELAPLGRDWNVSVRGSGAIHAQNVQINGGNLTSVGRDLHTHFHEAPKPEAAKVDVMAALESIDNFRGIQQDTLSKATPDTGKWIFEDGVFPKWRDPTSDVKTMWGTGIPGAGKTVLTSIVINGVEKSAEEQDSPICVCYIYIRYSDNAGFTVRYCLEVLVKQTVENHPTCLELAEDVYAKHIRLKTRPTEEELVQLLRGFTTMVAATFYFLDALDEAPTRLQFDLLDRLSSLKVKLFITSRPLKLLEADYPNTHRFTIAAHERDLDLHIDKEIQRSPHLRHILNNADPAWRASLVLSVKEKCGGMFLHVSLQMAALQECSSVHDVNKTLAQFPTQIEDVYRHTWDRIVDQAKSKIGFQAQNCIIWALNAPNSMTVDELRHAAATCLETHEFSSDRLVDIKTLVSLCCGLLAVDERTALVRLVHYTAKEPLERLILETFPHLHSLMTSLCMGRLMHHGFQDWKDSSKDAFKRVMKADPLLPYSYHAWSRHAQNSLRDPSMATKVKEFVRGCRSFPVELGYPWDPVELLGPLHVAAFFNLPISITSSHLINTFDPNRRTKQRNFTPLHLASMHPSHFDTLKELLSLRLIHVNAASKRGETPLICAVESGNEGAVKHLLAHPKIRLDLTDKDGLTAFTTAARKGNEAVVKAILAHSPGEIHSTDGNGQTALSAACEGGHLAMVKLLLSHSQSEVRLADNDGRTPLSWAASSRCIKTFKHILSLAQDDVHLADKQGRTPLSWASSAGGEEAVKILLAYPGTDINQVDNRGRTPLSWASQYDREGVAKVLLANPLTNVNLADTNGWTPLIWASKWWDEVASMRALLAHPQIGVNLQDNQGRTALIWAVIRGRFEQVKLLLAHPDIKVNLPDREGLTPLIWATKERPWREEEIMQALLAHPRTDVNHADNQGWTALSWASKRGHEGIVKLLLEHPEIGASHRPDNQGRTPLGWASKEGHKKIAELLLAHSPIQPQSESEPDRSLGGMLDSAVQKVHRLWKR